MASTTFLSQGKRPTYTIPTSEVFSEGRTIMSPWSGLGQALRACSGRGLGVRFLLGKRLGLHDVARPPAEFTHDRPGRVRRSAYATSRRAWEPVQAVPCRSNGQALPVHPAGGRRSI